MSQCLISEFFEISNFRKLSTHFRWLCSHPFSGNGEDINFDICSHMFLNRQSPQFLNMKSYPSFKPRFFLPGFHSHAIHITWLVELYSTGRRVSIHGSKVKNNIWFFLWTQNQKKKSPSNVKKVVFFSNFFLGLLRISEL